MYNDIMIRTTVVAPEEVMDAVKTIAREEGLSVAEVVRQGLELRIEQSIRPPRFIGSGESGEFGHDTGARSGDMKFEPRPWR